MSGHDDEAIHRLVGANPGQATFAEYALVRDAVVRRAPCRMLVFGVGRDMSLWLDANRGGETYFVEDDARWIAEAMRHHPEAHVHRVRYRSIRGLWRWFVRSSTRLELRDLPDEVTDRPWDIVVVDGPRGTRWHTPGRMKSIHAASRLAEAGGDVFVHDCHRHVERTCADLFLGAPQCTAEVGSMRHYRRP
ncbi:MAG: hypothetical protein AAF389_04040 [Gemmatimonadota bacterium]